MPKLKPCPFCGWEVIWKYETNDYEFKCKCSKCGASSDSYGKLQEAIEAWNRRVSNA